MKIGITNKLTGIEYEMHVQKRSWDDIIKQFRDEEKPVDEIIASHHRQKDCIKTATELFPNAVPVDMIAVAEKNAPVPELDLLVILGGDNFFQICTHHFPNAYLVGVNSDPVTSEGNILPYTLDRLIQKAEDFEKLNFGFEWWTRIATYINGERKEDGTCTVSISTTNKMCTYSLQNGDVREKQKSSGILVVSGAGSGEGSWYQDGGLYLPQVKSGLYPTIPQSFAMNAPYLMSLTREPHRGEKHRYKMLNSQINFLEELKYVHWTRNVTELSIDSIKEYTIRKGDVVAFKVSDKPLKIVI
jgi:NAD kinase